MFENVKKYIDDYVVGELGLPYFDVSVRVKNEEVYRYFNGTDKGVCGKEKLVMYSMTKPIIAITMAKLIEEKKLSLDDDVSKFIPCYKDAFILDDNGNKVKPKFSMKIKHLLTMSSGLSYNFATSSLINLFDKTNDKCSTKEVIETFVKEPLLFSPSEKFYYGLSFDVLGYIIEVVSGKKLSQCVDEIIFSPLNMKDSTLSNSDVHYDDCYKLVTYCGKKNFQPINSLSREYVSLVNYESGGAGLKSTIADYSKFAGVLSVGGKMPNGKYLIKPETLSLFSTLKMQEVSVQKTFGCVQGEDYGYGFGLRVRKVDTDWGLSKGEFGWDGAFGSYLMVDPNKNISVVSGMNVNGWPEFFIAKHLELVKEIYKNF